MVQVAAPQFAAQPLAHKKVIRRPTKLLQDFHLSLAASNGGGQRRSSGSQF